MKKNIAVVAGGDSSEYIVSVKSAVNVMGSIDPNKYNAWLVEIQGRDWSVMENDKVIASIDKNDFSFTVDDEKTNFDYAYIIIHGTPGEDGKLQGYFDLIGIPYSSCGSYSSALTFDKYRCNRYLTNFDVNIANSLLLKKGDNIDPKQIVDTLGLPIFVKPNAGGSSFGITKVKSMDEVEAAVLKSWDESDEAIIESFIDGQEFTCGLVKVNDKVTVFPLTEVLHENEFFDFEAKYTTGKADEITPARLSSELTTKCQETSSRIYDLLNCKGIVRMDYLLQDGEFWFLEVNTVPGMTATSFIPQQIEAMGVELSSVLSEIIEAGGC